jgi:short-subunit dehydrogenase
VILVVGKLDMVFTDKVVVITGASSGIGRELAIQLARKNNKVVLAARSGALLDENVELIKKEGGVAIAVPTDVSRRFQVENLARRTVSEFGRIDVWINNAAITHPSADLTDLKEDDVRSVIEINLMGCIYGVWAAVPLMEKTGGGQLIFVSSVIGKRGIPTDSIYCATKFAIQGLTESIRPELARKKIHVLNVCPPGVETPFFTNNKRGTKRRFKLHAVDKIARLIIQASEKEKRDVVLTMDGQLLVTLNTLIPGLLDKIIPSWKKQK